MPVTVGGAAGTNTYTGGQGDQTFTVNTGGGNQTDIITDFGSIYFTGNLTGAQQSPAVTTNASGTVTAELLKGDSALDFQVQLHGLDLGGQTASTADDVVAAHFHLGAPGTNGGIVFGFIGVPNNDADGKTVINAAADTVTGAWDANEGNGTTLTAMLSSLMAGNIYINFHTNPNPGGEIRAALTPQDDGKDVIDLSSTGITSFSQLQSLTHDVNGSANITIAGAGGTTTTLVLQNVATASLSASDFVFAGQAPPADALTQDFMTIHLGRAPTTDEAATLASLNSQVSAGTMTQAQAIEAVIHTADNETSVANEIYQFFTGATPSYAGLQFLVHGGGNANDLTSAYYAQFNLENRYINFAANLGISGAGAATFAANYGSMTFAAAVSAAYNAIIGDTNATNAGVNVNAAIAFITSEQSYFAAYGGDGPEGIGTKAAMVGYIIAEGTKGDIGAYAAANTAFLNAMISGTAQYHVDLVGTYAPTMAPGYTPPMPTNPYGY